MPNISRGRVATQWFLTRNERKKEARQGPGLMARRVPAPVKFSWTPEKDAALRLMWDDRPRSEIAPALGCSPNTIYDRAEVLGLPKHITCPKRAHVRWKKATADIPAIHR